MASPTVARDFSFQASAGYISTALQLARGVILARLLGPVGLGKIALVLLVYAYAAYADLGVAQAVSRQIPLARGARDDELALSWSGGLLLQGLTNVWLLVFQASLQFGRVFTAMLTLSVSSFVLGIVGALVAGVEGVFVGQLGSFALSTAVCFWIGGVPRPEPLHWRRVKLLFHVGVPLALLTFAGYNLVNVDQVMVVSLLGGRQLGLYTLVLYAGAALYLLPTALAAAVGPRLLSLYGETSRTSAIAGLTWRPARLLAVSLPLIIAVTWTTIPVIIKAALPEYVAIIGPLRIYLVGMFFLSLNLGVSTFLLALNKHRYNIPVIAGCIGLNVLVDLLFVAVLDWGLSGIALGSAVTYFTYWMVHTTLVRWFHQVRPWSAIGLNLRLGWPGLGLALLAAYARWTGSLTTSSLVRELPILVFGVVVAALGRRTLTDAVHAMRRDASRARRSNGDAPVTTYSGEE
jgi:O-antigen/teichoic acid export membrane protein